MNIKNVEWTLNYGGTPYIYFEKAKVAYFDYKLTLIAFFVTCTNSYIMYRQLAYSAKQMVGFKSHFYSIYTITKHTRTTSK